MAEIPLDVLGRARKTWNPLSFTYIERPSAQCNTTKNEFPKQPLTAPLSALSSLYRYLTEEVENEQEPYFYRNVMKKVATKKKKKETLAARAKYQAKTLLG